MRHLSLLSATLCLLSAAQAVHADERQQAKGLLIENVVVVDVRADSEQKARVANQSVLIEQNRITQVTPGKIDVAQEVRRIDGTGKYLVPGFWDMHAHVHWAGDDTVKVVLPLMFANGITGLRDMSSDNFPPSKTLPEIRKMQEKIERGELLGPRFMALCRRINGARGLFRLASVAPRNKDEGREAARLASLNGCDFIKVYSGLSRDAFFGLMEEANRIGLPVSGHLPQAVTPEEASHAGMRCIEHARFPALACGPDYEAWRAASAAYAENPKNKNPRALFRKNLASVVAQFDEERCKQILDVLAKNGTHLCPTHTTRKMDALASDPSYRTDARRKFITIHRLMQWDRDLNATARVPPDLVADFQAFYKIGLKVTGLAHRRGVSILAGTDTYDTHVFPGFSYHDELEHLHQAGLSPLEVLQAATIRPAKFLGKDKLFGSVEVNKVADLVMLEADPLADIRNTRTVYAVVFNGKMYGRGTLQKMIRGVEQYVSVPKTPQLAFWHAVLTGDVPGAKSAIRDGADVDAIDMRLETAGRNGRRALNYAALQNDTKMIEALLEAGAGINLANRTGFTALHHAAEYGAKDAAKMLIAKGADLERKTSRGWTALQIAEARGRAKTAAAIRHTLEKR